MSLNKLLKSLTLATVLIAAAVMAQTPYDEGQKALREQNWTAAAEQFETSIKADPDNADASMYWRAHALYKAGRKNEAERQVRNLKRKYPDSRWVNEARVLQIENDGSAPVLAATGDDPILDEELRMFALAQLMERDPGRAVPLVLDMMNSTESESVRKNSLFILGMSDDPRAQQAIAQMVRDSNDPALQVDAIHMLGVASNQPSYALLADLYREANSNEVRQAVIQAYIVGDQSQPLFDILKSEQNPALQTDIIHALGVMDATADLRVLYPTLTNAENRVAALEAFSLAGDTQTLRQVLDTETDPELRKTAIRGIAMEGGKEAAALLESIYDNASFVEEKLAVLDALMMMDDAQALALKIVRTETNPELQRSAIQALGMMDATAELAELYASTDKTELRKLILEAMMVADDTDGLMELLQSEKDPELRSAAIQMLALTDDQGAAQYLVTLYPDASREEKQAVIESMMITENAQGLVSLLKTETDPELKRQMLQMLTTMDSAESEQYLLEMLENKG